MRSYTELIQLESYSERLEYLKLLDGNVRSPRSISRNFYKSKIWLKTREIVIARDLGFDLGVFGVYIDGPIYVHHINPITDHDILYLTDKVLDLDNLITTSGETHNTIHYKTTPKEKWVERTPGDTILW